MIPSWLPPLVQPEDLLVIKILAILLIVAVGVMFIKGGEKYGNSL